MIKLELTPQEANNLRGLMDAATKACGMQAAEIALPIDFKIREAAQTYEKNKEVNND